MNTRFLKPKFAVPAIAMALALAIVAGFGLMVLKSAEVVDKGELLPYVKGYSIYKVRVLDRYEFYVEPDYKPESDALNSFVLVGIAFISLTFAIVIRELKIESAKKAFTFFICMFFGACAAAADEFLGIHESLGHNMQFLTDIVPIAERPDDAIIMFYCIPALLFVAVFFRTLFASKAAIACFVAAVISYGVGAVADGYALYIEEYCEMLTSILLISGVISLGVHHIRQWRAENGLQFASQRRVQAF
jgi:hypothetical protein